MISGRWGARDLLCQVCRPTFEGRDFVLFPAVSPAPRTVPGTGKVFIGHLLNE